MKQPYGLLLGQEALHSSCNVMRSLSFDDLIA